MTQLGIEFAPRPVAIIPAAAPPHDPGKRRALHRAALHILALLQDGQAHSRLELQAVGGNRYGARLNAIRAAGHMVLGPLPQPRRGIFQVEPMRDGMEFYRWVRP